MANDIKSDSAKEDHKTDAGNVVVCMAMHMYSCIYITLVLKALP